MILRRMSLFLALLFGVGATQLPEYVQQYEQRLGGAIDELSAIVAGFDASASKQGLSETDGINRLLASSDPLARQQGEEKRDIVTRLQTLRESREAFRASGPVGRLATFATHVDTRVARGALGDYQPAVPTTPEAFVIGLIGFLLGGALPHVAATPFRRRRGGERGRPKHAV